MCDNSLIDVESLDFSDDQTWLCKAPDDSGQKVDILDFSLSCDYPFSDEEEYARTEAAFYAVLDDIISKENNNDELQDRHKFDSRTFVKPKRRVVRPSMVDLVNMGAMTPRPANPAPNKYLTYNKYNSPLGQVSPMLRMKTFNVDTNTDNSHVVKDYASKRRSLLLEDDPQLMDVQHQLIDDSGRLSDQSLSKPIDIDLSQPAHHIHSSFKAIPIHPLSERPSLSMYGSGESLMRMSPPSLVTSLQMETSGTFLGPSGPGAMAASAQTKINGRKGNALTVSGRDSVDPLMTSMTLSILDEKDMSTSFLSQTTYTDQSLIDSMPPSLVSSVNSSCVATAKSEGNVFSSATFTHLSPSDRLLTARPRHQMFNSFTKRDSRTPDSDDKSPRMSETVTLFTNQYPEAEKENVDFETDDAFYTDMGLDAPRGRDANTTVEKREFNRDSLNVTLDKQELNEIIQARQKLSLARKAMPALDRINTSPNRTIHLPNQTITVPKQSIENANELLARRRQNGEREREAPRRSATFKATPKLSMDTTVVYMKPDEDNKIIDINSATMNLIDSTEKLAIRESPSQVDWTQARAMSGSGESTDTGTFSSSSPPERQEPTDTPYSQISSTPQTAIRRSSRNDLINIMTTISPIYDLVDDKSYTVTRAPGDVAEMQDRNLTVINSATIVRRSSAKREILGQGTKERSPSKLVAPSGTMGPPSGVPKKSGLPSSKLRQYSSHRELNRIPAAAAASQSRPAARGGMTRRGVYASNPVLSPPAAHPAAHSDGYIYGQECEPKTIASPPPLIRQGTETLRRERPQSLVAPRDYRPANVTLPGPTLRTNVFAAPAPRPSIPAPRAAARPSSVPSRKINTAPLSQHAERAAPSEARPPPDPRPSSDTRLSALPRPTRLPAPKRSLRPPSVYSAAPTDYNQY